jgi:type I restriction enzyme S subunit
MAERAEFRISDLAELFDGPHATPKRINEGAHFLNIASLSDGRLDLTKSDHVSDEDFRKWTRRVTPQSGDLLFSYETRLGEAALMPTGVKACLGRRMALMRPDTEVVDSRFLLYLYLSPTFKRLIEKNTIHGATVNRIALSTMPEWTVQLPSLTEQRAIAEVLGALDDKIAINGAIASTAWDLARTEFARTSASAAEPGVLGELLRLEYGKSLPARAREPGENQVVGSGGTVGQHSAAIVNQSGVVVGRKGTAGAVHWIDGPHWPIDTTFFATPIAPEVSQAYAYFLLGSLKLDKLNSDSAVPGLNRVEAEAIKLLIPSEEARASFTASAAPLIELASQTARESSTLANLRDALLPDLMSGRLRVKDAEKKIEEVV